MLYDSSRGGFFVMVLLTHVSTTAAALARYNVECRLVTIFRHFKEKARFIVELFSHYFYSNDITKLLQVFVDI